MLYKSNRPFVGLESEVQYIKDYLELEKLRYTNLKIDFSEMGISNNVSIAPMILQPFVENAFKHGISKEVGSQWLNLDISLNEDHLEFQVKNPKVEESTNDREGYTEGIGLKNVQKRLEILYPNLHELNIREDKNTFTIILHIDLEKHHE